MLTDERDERIAWILLDALVLGDGPAARKWKCSRRSVERYRARMRIDCELAALVEEKKAGMEVELSAMRVRFLRRALTVLEAKIQKDDATVYEIAGAVKIVGELHQVGLAVDDERPDGPDPIAPEDASGTDLDAATH